VAVGRVSDPDSIKDRIEATILRVAKERGVVMGTVAADHMAIDVLQAIREPTDLMGNGLPHDYKPGSHSASDIWRAMIDAALADVGAIDE
jgi:hypothetical protein